MRDNKGVNKQGKVQPCHKNAETVFKKWLPLFLCAVLACGLLVGCGGSKEPEKQDNDASNEQNNGAQTITIPEDMLIHTDYGDLHYPDCWLEYVAVRQEQSDNVIVVTFETKSGEKAYELFKILIGDGSGEIVGSLTDDAGTQRNVYLQVDELPAASGLEEPEQIRFYAMQEDLNYLIDNLK